MAFLIEPEPPRGVALSVRPGIQRLVAANAGPMTYHGTNTYLIDAPNGLIVLDPGPNDAAHVAAILGAGPVARILLSHTHHDHWGAVAALRAATGAPVHSWYEPAVPEFAPDVRLRDEDVVDGWQAVFTPGHAADHLCFAGPDGVLFSADHVMSWSSSVVSPPLGDMRAYFASLERLLARNDALYLPGHGPPLPDPLPFVRDLLAHRMTREASILAELSTTAGKAGPLTTRALTDRLYSQVDERLRRAAERNVLAHLLKLRAEGRAMDGPEGWAAT